MIEKQKVIVKIEGVFLIDIKNYFGYCEFYLGMKKM
jgi:hypothetical protein